jgi:voltage-gated potassium channel
MTRKIVNEAVIGVLAVISIILIAVESLVNLSNTTLIVLYIVDGAICLVFAWDFIVRLRASEAGSRFWLTSGYEILAMIPAVAFYALGMIPAISSSLRILRLIRVVRVIIVIARTSRVMKKSGGFLQRSHLLALSGISLLIVFIGAYVVLLLEQGTEGAQITNLSDAVWWSISTVTTVGYGDIVPESAAGRIMGMVLMAVGIGVMASFVSEFSATLVKSRMATPGAKDSYKSAMINEVKSRIDKIDELSESEVALLIQTIQLLRVKGGERGVD